MDNEGMITAVLVMRAFWVGMSMVVTTVDSWRYIDISEGVWGRMRYGWMPHGGIEVYYYHCSIALQVMDSELVCYQCNTMVLHVDGARACIHAKNTQLQLRGRGRADNLHHIKRQVDHPHACSAG